MLRFLLRKPSGRSLSLLSPISGLDSYVHSKLLNITGKWHEKSAHFSTGQTSPLAQALKGLNLQQIEEQERKSAERRGGIRDEDLRSYMEGLLGQIQVSGVY